MFIVRLAGEVEGEKRNVEVTFAARPSLQLLCTVAETVLPLRGHRTRPPWHPPWAAPTATGAAPPATTTAVSGSGALVPVGRAETSPLPAPTSAFTVDTLVCLDRATRTWTPLYSASQISSGAQVYCFAPLQHRRVVLVKRDPATAVGAAAGEGGEGDGPCRASPSARPTRHAHAGPPVVTGWRDAPVDTDRPGAIPPPQHRLLWHDAGSRSARGRSSVDVTGPSSSSFLSAVPTSVRHVEPASLSGALHTPEQSRGLRHPYATFPATNSAASSPVHASSAAAAAASSASAAEGRSGASASGPHPRAVAGLVRSLSPSRSQTWHASHNGARRPRQEEDTFLQSATARAPRPPRFQRRPADAAHREEPALLEYVPPEWSALLRGDGDGGGGGGGGARYAHLGERTTLIFDVLLRLDAHDAAARADFASGAETRRYLLLRDFYLLASYLADASVAGGYGLPRGSPAAAAAPALVTDITAQLFARFQWTWDDLVRHADQDRDGCITFPEWMSFGIEHPAVMLLLGRAVHALLLREAVRPAKRRSGTRSSSRDGVAEPLLLAPPPPLLSPLSAAAAVSTPLSAFLVEGSGSISSGSGSSTHHHRQPRPHRSRHPRHHRSLDVECGGAVDNGESRSSDAMYPCRVHRQSPVSDGARQAGTVTQVRDHTRLRCAACRELLTQAPASLCHRCDAAAQPHRFPETLRR